MAKRATVHLSEEAHQALKLYSVFTRVPLAAVVDAAVQAFIEKNRAVIKLGEQTVRKASALTENAGA